MMKKDNLQKNPTLKEKVHQYENFLHKINSFVISGCNEGIVELIQNADNWSYAHRRGNGEFSGKQQNQIINNAFWKLLDTPRTDAAIKERQKIWIKNNQKNKTNFLI